MEDYILTDQSFENARVHSNEEAVARSIYYALRMLDKIIYCFGDRLTETESRSLRYLIKRSEDAMITRGIDIEAVQRLADVLWKLIQAIVFHCSKFDSIRYMMPHDIFYKVFDEIECEHRYYTSDWQKEHDTVMVRECNICHKPEYKKKD